jgi:hypothetical protein
VRKKLCSEEQVVGIFRSRTRARKRQTWRANMLCRLRPIEDWRRGYDYDHDRSHSLLGNTTPAAYATSLGRHGDWPSKPHCRRRSPLSASNATDIAIVATKLAAG